MIGRLYNAEKKAVGTNQHTNGRVGQIDPPSSTADKIAKDLGVSSSKVKRAGEKSEKIDATGLTAAVNSGMITKISKAALYEIAKIVEAEPERKAQIVQQVIEGAKANNGRVKTAKKAVTPDPEPDDESEDPERSHALEDLSEQISGMIFDARKKWDDDFVAQLKRNVLEAFKKPLPDASKAPLPQTAPVMPVPVA